MLVRSRVNNSSRSAYGRAVRQRVTIRILIARSLSSCVRRQPPAKKASSTMKVNPFYTKNLREGAGHRSVYHDNNQCSDGKRILAANRESGTDGRSLSSRMRQRDGEFSGRPPRCRVG